jgi:hypothetical protein
LITFCDSAGEGKRSSVNTLLLEKWCPVTGVFQAGLERNARPVSASTCKVMLFGSVRRRGGGEVGIFVLTNSCKIKHVALRGLLTCSPICFALQPVATNPNVRTLVLERTPQGGYYSFTLYGARLLKKPRSGVVLRTCLGGDHCIQQEFSFRLVRSSRLLGSVLVLSCVC